MFKRGDWVEYVNPKSPSHGMIGYIDERFKGERDGGNWVPVTWQFRVDGKDVSKSCEYPANVKLLVRGIE